MNQFVDCTRNADAAWKLPQRIVIITDAWLPQMNGVVRTLTTTCEILRKWGCDVTIISPDQFRSVPCPTYPEIRLALARPGAVAARIAGLAPEVVHIATEGPLGFAARRYCVTRNVPFTTAYHTQFPDYLASRTPVSADTFWRYIEWFHRPAQRIMVATESIRTELRARGLNNLHQWSRGVDLDCFTPEAPAPAEFADLPRPIQLYVGRVSVEKNIEAFLSNPYPGSKVVVGDGPARAALERKFPHVHFLGKRFGRDLAGCYAGADVFVFPSKTDTFGLVMIEALACGTPVAAFPVPGPVDIVTDATGALSDALERAVAAAMFSNRADCALYGATFGWEAATRQFLDGLVPAGHDDVIAA
ncbi:glycosyltransferase family 1 protein [Pontixanthobacter aestiaquae]|uniref:Glycosyltransferase n=1 Tax=Pontixanthobacter aestiaquae TaxID=1509367 RepID=A0A844Z5I9_9SPHN|nr:glycosyltransferase family 1 protein [Pontixanthobacter aestiaquae]MDN3646928.1 glycosyltransferase family 1 protein [Pontixanthobacter aestiaquae]MXO82090.1 glycosyltransferase [Pontixanthobacter aestiaquae]